MLFCRHHDHHSDSSDNNFEPVQAGCQKIWHHMCGLHIGQFKGSYRVSSKTKTISASFLCQALCYWSVYLTFLCPIHEKLIMPCLVIKTIKGWNFYRYGVQVSPSQLSAKLTKKPQILLCSIDCLASKEVSFTATRLGS